MDRSLLKTTLYGVLALAALIAVFYFFLDRPVDIAARGLKSTAWFQAGTALSFLADHRVFNVLVSACFIFIGIKWLGWGESPFLARLLYCCLAVALAMLIGETVKWILGRYRPEMLFSQGKYGFSLFAAGDSRHSFPSGHNFRIFSAMTALSLAWPRGRVFFLTLACLVGASRVVVTRHFPSDVMAGAFLGVFCALWLWRIMRPGQGRARRAEAPLL